ncbi:unnamed protein product [Closterium sp. NIES-54]
MNPAPLGRTASRPAALGRVGRIRLLLVALGGAMILSGLRFVNRTTNLVAPASDEFANFTSFGERLRDDSSRPATSSVASSSSSSSTDISSDTSTSSASSSASSTPTLSLNDPSLQSQPIAAVPTTPNTSQPEQIPAVGSPENGFQISGMAVRPPPSKDNTQEAGSNQSGTAEDPVLALQRAVKPEGIKWPLLAVTPTHARAMQVDGTRPTSSPLPALRARRFSPFTRPPGGLLLLSGRLFLPPPPPPFPFPLIPPSPFSPPPGALLHPPCHLSVIAGTAGVSSPYPSPLPFRFPSPPPLLPLTLSPPPPGGLLHLPGRQSALLEAPLLSLP